MKITDLCTQESGVVSCDIARMDGLTAIARWEENMRRSFGTTQLHLCTEFYDRALAQTVAEDDSLVTEGYSAISRMKETEHLILLRHSASQWFFLAKDGFQGGAAELEKFRTFIAQKIGG